MLDKKTKTAVAKSFAQKGKEIPFLSAPLDSSPDSFVIDLKSNSKKSLKQEVLGQVVLEYVLLLAMGVIIGAIIMRNLIGTTEEPKGIRQAWACLIESIGQDQPGKPGALKRSSRCQ